MIRWSYHSLRMICQKSIELGLDGYVSFYAKTGLVTHYEETLGAISISKQRMFIDEIAAALLVNKYMR